jgi:hypothetical protein
MSILQNIFGNKDKPVKTYDDFWIWFQKNEKKFYSVVKLHKKLESDFFDPLSLKLGEIKEGFFFLTGMFDDNTAELVITPDGNIKNVVFVEELIAASPLIKGWKFTALKPEMEIKNVSIRMAEYEFNRENLFFYSNDITNSPDEIDITIVHNDYKEEDKSAIINGTYIFLDNYLGELNSITTIDNLTITSINEATKELIPIEKLKAYLIWRQKEFLEKYDGVRYNIENDSYSSFEAELINGKPMIAVLNTTLLDWDRKASHPWIANVEIKYPGKNNNGMPDDKTYQRLNEIEDKIMRELQDFEGYLNIGRQTTDNTREIYFACKDFRKPSKIFHQLLTDKLIGFEITYDIYKDKYWKTFNRFKTNF